MAGASSSGTKDEDVERLMADLGLAEDDLDDLVAEDVMDLSENHTRWMLVARVHTDKKYSQYWFYKQMRAAWNLAKPVAIRPLSDNLYTMQF